MKRIICILLLAAALLSAFSITAFADDNATGGDGSSHDAAKGYAWYNGYQYLWKVTVFVGKSDQASKQDNLMTDFHRIGTVVMKKTGWSVPSGTKFGSGTKVDYYAGAAMTMDASPYIISDANCPAIPIVNDVGELDTVKAYFGSTGTMSTILNGIAVDKGTTKEAMLSRLTFTIGGQTRSGWDYEYVDPNAETNRVPWLIVYEPMVILNLKDKVTKLAFTATEFALCELNGWYDWNKSGGEGQNCASLPEKWLPTSVQLEESWFGYPVYAVTDDSTRWNYTDVVKGGGWGMRWLPAAIKEPQIPDIDYGCSFGTVNRSPAVGSYGSVVINWTNYESEEGTVLCCLYRGETLLWSAWKTIPAGATIQTSLAVYYGSTDRQTLACTINWEHHEEETDGSDNCDIMYVTPVEAAIDPELDYGTYFQMIEQPDQDTYGQVDICWRNYTDNSGSALCELYLDGTLIWSETKTFGPNEYFITTYDIYFSGTKTRQLEARINYANRLDESDPSDNLVTEAVTPTKTVDDTYDFSVSDLSVSPSNAYQGKACAVTFLSDNWNHDVAYEDILVELLVDGEVVRSQYLDYSPFGRYRHHYIIYLEDLGTSTINARINWADRNAEDNRSNNSISTTATVSKYYDFSVSELKVEPAICYASDYVTVSFRTDSWDRYHTYTDVPVEVLYNGQVVYTYYADYTDYSAFRHTVTLNVGTNVGINEITARINWADRTSEVNSSNNSTEVELTVGQRRDLWVEAITPNSDYLEGLTVVTSYTIYNDSPYDVTPDQLNAVSFEAFYYGDNGKVVLSSQVWDCAVVPANGQNLVYFKWTIPKGVAGQYVFCRATVNARGTVEETHKDNNAYTLVQMVNPVPFYSTKDTQFEKNGPEGYTIPTLPSAKAGNATWSMWVYEDGTFVKKTYGIGIYNDFPLIQPDGDSPSAQYVNGFWRMRSGYGFYISYSPRMTAVSGCEKAPESAYTGVQRVEAAFPEFNYSQASIFMRTLQQVDGAWVFAQNPDADGQERLHFTPLWYPNGNYAVQVMAREVWTPAGMIYCSINSNAIRIVDSAYDDWYVGEQ